MKKNHLFVIAIFILAAFSSCMKDQSEIDVDSMTMDNIVVPSSFNYSTTKQIELSLTVPEYLNNAIFSIVAYREGSDSVTIGKAAFDEAGTFQSTFTIPVFIDTLIIRSEYVGLIDGIIVPILGNNAMFDYRPIYENTESKSAVVYSGSLKSASATGYTYLGTYTSAGVPTYLVQNDVVEQNLLDDVNASLPEYTKVPNLHPEYLASGTETNIVLTKKADVWVTFVSEGAGYRNSLGYYTYPVGKMPATAAEIEKLMVVIPNVSFSGSGGGLKSGNKVHLGQFDANTVVAWFLVADGWNGTNVGAGKGIFFSDPELNPETKTANKNHMVLLWDKARELLLMGFEDINRESTSCDQDFNDAVFYATTNPVDAVVKSAVQPIDAANDADGDGINDAIDDFPYDPNKAFSNFSPSTQNFGSLAYEDLWPSKGDYDFNDVVTDYQFNLIANASNQITSLKATYFIKHIGGSYNNGLAFILPVASTNVASVENQVMNKGYVSLNSNGTESGVTQTVIFVSEDVSVLKGDTLSVTVNFKQAVSVASLGAAPFNTFIVVDGDRGREVHLPDMPPTSKGLAMLGQGDDYSSPADGRYYKTDRNLPWALNFYSTFAPPAEKQSIDRAYPRFVKWANSGGTVDLDWYR